MIKPTIINILGWPNGILDLKKKIDKALENIPAVSEDLPRIAWKRISNNLILQEISILIFFQFYWKINKNE